MWKLARKAVYDCARLVDTKTSCRREPRQTTNWGGRVYEHTFLYPRRWV